MHWVDEVDKKVYNKYPYLNIRFCVCRSEKAFFLKESFSLRQTGVLLVPRVAPRKGRW